MSYRILIVEDEPGMIELLSVALEDEGFLISIAQNGQEGLKKVDTEDPDLIISDVMMPDMNGYEFCEQLRQNPKTASIPFIFLTAKKDVSDRVRGLNLGADDYISKPFHVVEVVARIKTLMMRVSRTKAAAPAQATPESEADFSGYLGKMSIGELIQTIYMNRKNGRLVLTDENRKGELIFNDAYITYAEVDRKRGEEAVYRLLSWKTGQFRFEGGVVADNPNVRSTAESLLMEGMRRLDEYARLLKYFPSEDVKLEALSVAPEGLEPEELQVLNYVNQYAALMDVIDHSKFGDLKTIQMLVKLHTDNIIGTKADDQSEGQQDEDVDFDKLAEDLFG
jgi:DNA-binding response OmpR family regulator